MNNDSKIALPPPSMPRCWTRVAITAPSAPCTGSWRRRVKLASAAINSPSMYRLLAQEGETRERRNQLTHPPYQKPELLATAPNQLWSWDITKLLGPAKWTYFYLYVILDVFSRYVVGWMVAYRETAELAKRL